ncbi:MAG: DUF2726 domain-containing protein [Burkholderiaceae bacterium]|nr:MAG: DUF2726 domain-containing protein [Burkholderiaceae bacterium]
MFSHFLDRDSKSEPDFEKRKFFAAEEEVFFKRLIKALPNCSIFPKVQLAAILEPHISNEKKRQIMRQKLQSRHVDFGIFDKNLELLCVVILEGDEEPQDEEYPTRHLLKSAGIKNVRWKRSALPTYEQVLRTLAPFSDLESPRAESSLHTIGKLFPDEDVRDGQVFTRVEHGNPNALSLAAIERITPERLIKTQYPHIWQKICLFAGDPGYLKNYLDSLFLQNRPTKRRGLPKPVANEVMAILYENSRFVISKEPEPIWDPSFLHR